MPLPLAPSLRAQRGNPDCFRGGILDCFAALAMTRLGQRANASPTSSWRKLGPITPGSGLVGGTGLGVLSINHAVWVPAPVRNCALGRDDTARVVGGAPTYTSLRLKNASRSNKCTSCSFFSSAPCSGGI